MNILIINGSVGGKNGNSARVVKRVLALFKKRRENKKIKISVVHLADFKWTSPSKKKMIKQLDQAAGVFFISGTYWDSWGSPLQLFLENLTDLEGRSEILGKPAAVCILNHSVGGKGVLSRLQGVLSTFGFLIPPMAGMVYSWVNQEVRQHKNNREAVKDLWSIDDLVLVVRNFEKTLHLNIKWESWPVDRKNFRKVWLKS